MSDMRGLSRLIHGITIAFALFVGLHSAVAQEQSTIRAKLDGLRLELDQIETAVTTRLTSDSALQTNRKRVDQITVDVKAIADEQSPRADAVRARLKELGPRPDDKTPPESPEITKERDVALLRILAVSVISTIKVDRPRATLSLAPMRV